MSSLVRVLQLQGNKSINVMAGFHRGLRNGQSREVEIVIWCKEISFRFKRKLLTLWLLFRFISLNIQWCVVTLTTNKKVINMWKFCAGLNVHSSFFFWGGRVGGGIKQDPYHYSVPGAEIKLRTYHPTVVSELHQHAEINHWHYLKALEDEVPHCSSFPVIILSCF